MREFDKDPTWKEWEREMLDDYDTSKRYEGRRSSAWLSLGNWLYPAKENGGYRKDRGIHVVYHVCKKNYERNYSIGNRVSKDSEGNVYSSIASIEIGCQLCGKKVPNNFKMIMMLERL